jgi:hypothetical protein
MGSAFWPRTGFSYLRNVIWSPSSACILAAVVLSLLLPMTAGRDVLPAPAHPETCRACAWTSPKTRASIERTLIAIGAIEAPSAPNRL